MVDTIIYHGSFAELKDRHCKKEVHDGFEVMLSLARKENFRSNLYECQNPRDLDKRVSSELEKKGYIGLVNARTNIIPLIDSYTTTRLGFIEGTPITLRIV